VSLSSLAETTKFTFPLLDDRVPGPTYETADRPKLALIGFSHLLRECLSRALSEEAHFDTVSYSDADDARLKDEVMSFNLLVIFVPGAEPGRSIAATKHILDQIGEFPPFVVLADSEDADEVLAAFELGARSYIPTSVTLDVMTEAINLGIADGAYYPTSILSAFSSKREPKPRTLSEFTPREFAIFIALREGHSNKVIAEELGISESTIKVHVHRIMKKLKVHNRTQAALRGPAISSCEPMGERSPRSPD
jgi:DNA-binding NarL/FixJ family response regulator